MRIFINGSCLDRDLTGVERYLLNVLNEFDALLAEPAYQDLQLVLLLSPACKYDLSYEHIEMRTIGSHHGNLWEQLDLPLYTRGEYLLSLHSFGPIFKQKHVLVFHDAKVAHKGKGDNREASRLFHFYGNCIQGKLAPRIIAITEFAKQDILSGFHVAAEKITVILSGQDFYVVPPDHDAEVLAKYGLERGNYVFALGGGATKNNGLTARAVALLGDEHLSFVLAGHAPQKVLDDLAQFPQTHCIGRVSDEELGALYRNALCLGFPSLVEGFGRPPLEAMVYQCPVIASRCEAVPEVCGEAALYVDAHDPKDMAEKIRAYRDDPALRAAYIAKGNENLKRFSWNRTARGILAVMRQVMEEAEP